MKTRQLLILIFTFSIPFAANGDPFTANRNGTVTDQKAGLLWQKCSMGQNVDSTCSGTATTATWVNAVAYCQNLTLAGRSDWRLPNINELKSIEKETVYNPAIDTSSFPGTVAGYYWSSSTYVYSPAIAWLVYFGSGYAVSYNRTVKACVRCLAGP